ncbi:ParB/RepB/Spo0J family partition protein [Nevskia ramosa]|uniref:ParB/RepB/Spo0J family partition protein n=1 Tax=Nevskia ramosa TaxID=64002 RepID=UPI0003B49E48|nr:ParB/RepB/Spo0J family partition protein [Nevskia ramosa]
MSVKKRGLGRSLDALLGSSQPQAVETAGDELRELALDSLVAGRHQPRRSFDQSQLEALAESIKAQGVVQPIIVREIEDGQHEIVAGERRWRAAKLAGLSVIPAVVRKMEDRAAMAVALVENIQRADLNPLEEAEALRRLIDDCGLTHEQAAEAVGKSRASISNLLRLIDLDPGVQMMVRNGLISLGHAKVLMGATASRQAELAKQVVERELTVRQTEALLMASSRPASPPSASLPKSPIASEIGERIGLPVTLTQSPRGKGKLVISFDNNAQLQQVLKLLR